ncbi:succinate dehydrogenase/fumarate reductase flavoprotein subunit [Anaerotaenia torta]|uniref:hypothetical protein n=1 Tax=Anaerotaenia torta TaxID=433293 RepID=UPI003D1B7B3F
MTLAVNTYVYDAVVVGSGCAGFNAADSLYDMGVVNICLITEGIKKGTSRNTGSDKQTYYKLSLSSSGSANLQEWQYGLASVKFRWNVSGTYQQVLPRYYSVDAEGVEREFLFDSHLSEKDVMERVFLKGCQWPFDVNKLGGSSDIDMLVYHETEFLGRKVYMDFRKNPMHLDEAFQALPDEAFTYLKNSGALFGTPIERLEKMNPKAIELYRSHNIDLYKEPLEVKVCAQHQNGGRD